MAGGDGIPSPPVEILHLFPGQGPETAAAAHFHRINCDVHKAARCADERQSNDQFFAYAIRRNQKRRMAGGTVRQVYRRRRQLAQFYRALHAAPKPLEYAPPVMARNPKPMAQPSGCCGG